MEPPARIGAGWQYALADLSLILFMICAAALAQRPLLPPAASLPVALRQKQSNPADAPALADPVAVWRPAPDGPSLDSWLAGQALDPRQRLTIIARYADHRSQAAFVRAEKALGGVRKLPGSTRIVVEPAGVDEVAATLTWDGSPL